MTLSVSLVASIVIPLLLLEGFFSGSEIALLSVDRLKLKAKAKAGSRSAKRAVDLASHPERVLSTTLAVTSLCVISISAIIALHFLERGDKHSDLAAILVTSPLIVLFGELLPKTLFRRHAEVLAPWVSWPVEFAYRLLFPLTRLLSGYTTRLSRFIGPVEELIAGKKRTTRDEIRSVLSLGKKESELKSSERKMIRRIFDFKDAEAKHALIPLVRVEAISESATIHEAIKRFLKHRHSRMPVYSGRIDNIVGVLEVADLLGAPRDAQSISDFVTQPHYVPETQSLEDLLSQMLQDANELVVVVDEYGGAIGILTFEDIVEEIVGEISDEKDQEKSPYQEITPTRWLIHARMEIQALNDQLKLELPEGDYETLGGFLLQQFGRIPEERDELFFDTPSGSLRFSIRKASERSIEKVLVERLNTK